MSAITQMRFVRPAFMFDNACDRNGRVAPNTGDMVVSRRVFESMEPNAFYMLCWAYVMRHSMFRYLEQTGSILSRAEYEMFLNAPPAAILREYRKLSVEWKPCELRMESHDDEIRVYWMYP